MGRVGDLVVRIIGEDAQFRSSIDKSEKKLKDFDKTAKKVSDNLVKVGKKMTTFVTLPILGIGAAFIKTAADAEEVNSKFNIVFRDQAENVRGWAEEFSQATGRATVDNIKFLASVQDLFVPLGLARDEAADLSKSVVTLATDMGSFNNLPTKDVLRDIQSALVGNHETVRKYGVVLSEVTVNQELLNMGIEGGYKAATAAEKAIARYNLIIAGTSDAQGDAIRTAGSFTNRFIALQSSVKDLAEGFGNLLLPAIQKMVEGITEAVRWIHDLDETQKQWLIRIAGIAAAAGPLIFGVGKMIAIVRTLRTVILALNTTMLATPWGAALIAVVALTAVIWKLNEASRDEKKLEKDIIALKDELNKVRGEEKVRIQETIVAKLRDAFVTAEAEALKLEALTKSWDAYGKMDAAVASVTRSTNDLREKADALNEKLQRENEILVQLVETEREDNAQRVIKLPILEEEEEATKKNTEAKKEQVKANWDMADSYEGMGTHIATAHGIYREWRATWDTEDEETKENKEALVDYNATALEVVQASTRAHNERHAIIAENLKQEAGDVKELDTKYQQLALTISNYAIPMFEAFGQVMVDQADAAEILGKAFQDMIVGILKAIAQKLTILGIEALIPIPGVFNPIGAPAAFAGAAAAAVAAGVVAALQQGGLTTGMTPAILHPNEAVLPLDNSEAMGRIADAIAGARAPSVTMGDNLVHVSVNLGNKVLYDDITRATKDRKILVDAGAVV